MSVLYHTIEQVEENRGRINGIFTKIISDNISLFSADKDQDSAWSRTHFLIEREFYNIINITIMSYEILEFDKNIIKFAFELRVQDMSLGLKTEAVFEYKILKMDREAKIKSILI